MNFESKEHRRKVLLHTVSKLPKEIIQMHGTENMVEFVLHHLILPECFNLKKAAYFIDNPDFNHCKGLTGITQEQRYNENHWGKKEHFTTHMKNSDFNLLVRSLEKESFLKKGFSEDDIIKDLALALKFENPYCKTWKTKYDNNAIFLYETSLTEDQDVLDEHLEDSLYFLNFCPVF